mgnify:CR=1 FL=1
MSASSVIVVTGGASGIGAACVKHFVRRGDTVVVIDLPGAWKPERMGVAVAAVYEGDVTDDTRMRALVDIIEGEHGPVTGLINCAGILQHRLPPETLTMAEWDRVIAVDQRGTYLASVVFGERMARRGVGGIVNIASITGTLVPIRRARTKMLMPAARLHVANRDGEVEGSCRDVGQLAGQRRTREKRSEQARSHRIRRGNAVLPERTKSAHRMKLQARIRTVHQFHQLGNRCPRPAPHSCARAGKALSLVGAG